MLGELDKLEANLGGVADMRRQPDAVFIVDLKKEQLAVREARRLGLPVVALVDTNCDPDEADYVIPGIDDAIRSCSLVVRAVADGIEAGQRRVTAEELATTPATDGQPATEPEPEPAGERLPDEIPAEYEQLSAGERSAETLADPIEVAGRAAESPSPAAETGER